ncbi:MAG: hypothetical protein ACOYMG_17260 [Candidatus Methylumidiphilus sp.]
MKIKFLTFAILFLALTAVTDAQAVVCARGVYRAGCAGPNGAVVARRPVAPRRAIVVAPRRVVVAPVRRGGYRRW